MMTIAAELALEHFLLRLRPLNRALQVAVERQGQAAKRLIRPDVAPLCVTEDQVLTLLGDVDILVHGSLGARQTVPPPPIPKPAPEEPTTLVVEARKRSAFWRWVCRGGSKETSRDEAPSEEREFVEPEQAAAEPLLQDRRSLAELASLRPDEHAREQALRYESTEANIPLPLERLSQALSLSPFEEEVVLLCAAPELDRSYERIYAFILDDMNRRYPCVELLSTLTADSVPERIARRHALSRFGRLRRTGILQVYGDPPTELRQEVRLAPGLFDYLTGGTADMISRFRDPADVPLPVDIEIPIHVGVEKVQRLTEALRVGYISVLGIWGPGQSGKDQLVPAIASRLKRPLRRYVTPATEQMGTEETKALTDSIHIASALGAILWIDTESLAETAGEQLSRTLADALAASQVPVLLTGIYPWRPLQVLEERSYAEIELKAPSYGARKTMWSKVLPGADEERAADLAARFRMSGAEMRAAARLSRVAADLASEEPEAKGGAPIEGACLAVTRKRSHRFATVVEPKRGPDDLILPKALHDQVMEVAHFTQAWPRVAEEWGFGRLETGNGSVKALFTGESGTGKTLAAEVVAGELKMPLLIVDLARIVSKWVGETAQHLESAFRLAEDSNAVLCFDECDALFGKRGEIQHGVDRYANMEVSYLLQRLETHSGPVIAASNLRDMIDEAFIRRFQVVLHFSRPNAADRRRIWAIAFPEMAPLEEGLDLDTLARLDMTGAAIVGAARTAALIAADEKSATIAKSHVVRAIARQYRREARVLSPGELGPYAGELKEAR